MDSRYQPYDQMKRTRQACEPCRRKKSKCTGERPGCSTCARLRQRCFYAVDPRPRAPSETETAQSIPETLSDPTEPKLLSTRIQSLESTLAEVLESLRQDAQNGVQARRPDLPERRPLSRQNSRLEREDTATSLPMSSRLATSDLLPPWPAVLDAARDYLHYCDSQPIPLFDPESFLESLPDRDPEIIYGILALTRRSSRGPPTNQYQQVRSQEKEQEEREQRERQKQQEQERAKYVQAAHRLAMGRVTEGRVELSTIQTLCLLSLIEFYNGAIDRSRVHSSLANTLAHCALLHREINRQDCQPATEERRRCYWGLVLLRRLLGWSAEDWEDCASGSSSSGGGGHARIFNSLLPLFPASPSSPLSETAANQTSHGSRRAWTEAERHDGILSTVIQLAEVWSMAQDYVRTRGRSVPGPDSTSTGSTTVPWSPQSKYSRALRRLMNLGQDLPPLHRNRCIRLANVTAEDLRGCRARAYWAPWFLSHFLYHTAICLLNHPLLMTLQFQGARGFSEVFLQQTTHLAAYHTSWVLHFIDFFNRREFITSDPIFGYCAAVIATIELQHSFSNDRTLRHKARYNYDHCVDFLRNLSREWPYIKRLTQKLDTLEDQMAHHDINDSTLTVNISGFLEILDMATSSRMSGSIFADTLLVNESPEETMGPTPLSRLPGITTMDPAKATGRGEQEKDNNNNSACAEPVGLANTGPDSPTSSSLVQPPLPQQHNHQHQHQQQQHTQNNIPSQLWLDANEAMFLPVDQLLGGHLHDVNAWWSGTWGDAAGSWVPNGVGRSNAWPLNGNETYQY